MKQLVICPENFHLHYDRVLSYGSMILHEVPVNYALIEKEDIAFDPEIHHDKVLVRKHAFSCNYRDISLILLASYRINSKPDAITYFSIGSEFAGVVEEVGSNVQRFKKGDKVICDAFYPQVPGKEGSAGLPTNHASSELEIISEHKLMLMPENMSFPMGAAFTIGAQTVYSMLEKLDIKENQRILVTGIKSNTSLFAINALRKKNVEVCGITRSSVDEVFFKRLGLEQIFYIDDQYSTLLENNDILQYIQSRGKFNCVIDPFSDSYLFKVLDLIDINGKYITCGLSNQTVAKDTPLDISNQLNKIILSNITIMGNCLGSTETLENAISDYSNEQFDVIIDNVVDKDINYFMSRTFLAKDKLGKVVFSY